MNGLELYSALMSLEATVCALGAQYSGPDADTELVCAMDRVSEHLVRAMAVLEELGVAPATEYSVSADAHRRNLEAARDAGFDHSRAY